MHIPDGFLPAPVYLGGFAIAGLTTWYSLRQIRRYSDPNQQVPKAALLTAAFFVASSIHVPIPPASVHFVLNGLLGVVLGYFAFPAILVGLFFQAVMFGHGGLASLGVNAVLMGLPALVAAQLFRLRPQRQKQWAIALSAFGAGAIGLGLSALIFFSVTIATIPAGFDSTTERAAILGLAIAHLPLAILEGIFTAMLVLFLCRVKPELLEH
ncbi:cobalt transporter CbiM [Desertifilum sp. FACHB-1129]|uniref:Cobalamin biosynthesis protein CbiM n=2 Tax=Desertifilum tharense IPPAS B-1220 TaxID=1781255 RepID=A0A1E5QPZ4_9CYAN|nr:MULTISPECIES: cobalt transporter CbiM [Desertifilum]MDA0210687.1 cobalt transporter CbiM [Cyanobacteria bacterium FC1]MBD2312902.1 cobalt transporter CbiM [Desertifilum sp. FACHB-1129]MBD2323778.1 cobalt transporter CbiM [Desertifilum sp. FACHB-866]MBD2333623.1 cobalt transporter CbiM [Desertifilum sp. FACHB-868]OEJ76413.1 cobalamin biosynthesis protein CbiM [Desertifilum tharense IPPAS B-1220]